MNYKIIVCILTTPFVLPHYIVFKMVGGALLGDFNRYKELYEVAMKTDLLNFTYILLFCRTFRNVLYYRIGKMSYLLKYIKPVPNCEIHTKSIGPGLFIEHGGATYISARTIGANFYINQCATVGFSNKSDHPDIGDNVSVKAGAKVFGNCKIGNNVVIGANSVVFKNVPDNCVVVGVPGKIVKKNGLKVDLVL